MSRNTAKQSRTPETDSSEAWRLQAESESRERPLLCLRQHKHVLHGRQRCVVVEVADVIHATHDRPATPMALLESILGPHFFIVAPAHTEHVHVSPSGK